MIGLMMPAAANSAYSRVGRTTKLTRKLAHWIYEYLKAGASQRAALWYLEGGVHAGRRPCIGQSAEHEHVAACRYGSNAWSAGTVSSSGQAHL